MIKFRTDFDVKLVSACARDSLVVQAARVSTLGEKSLQASDKEVKGLINYLMQHRHGSPFEHNYMTFYVSAPIFVFREFMRHRIASYNEESARYKELDPIFYIPPENRPLVPVGTSARPEMIVSRETWELTIKVLRENSINSYNAYQQLLLSGCCREIARCVLPVNIYSSMYVTLNARSLMNFLALRTSNWDARTRSYPQWEIEQVAIKIESEWQKLMPITHQVFCNNERVAP